MAQPERFETLVLGSGEGGKYLAWHMAKSGQYTAVIERKLIGGSCPNTNCLCRFRNLDSSVPMM
jgi:pyruvate/2-oxoglutarate dehydrogenase complex dihydrolipoamide dehydrogenase (E3) component